MASRSPLMQDREFAVVSEVEWDNEKLSFIGMRDYPLLNNGVVSNGKLSSIHVRPPGDREMIFERHRGRDKVFFRTEYWTPANTNVRRTLANKTLIKYLGDPQTTGYFVIDYRNDRNDRMGESDLDDYINSIPGVELIMGRGTRIAYPINMLYLTLQPNERESTWTDGLEIIVQEPVGVDRDMIINTLMSLLERPLELADRTLDVVRLFFDVESKQFNVYTDDDRTLVIDTLSDDLSEEEAINSLIDWVSHHIMTDVSMSFDYIVAPGPFDYTDLLERVPDADSMAISAPDINPAEFVRDIDDNNNEYLAQFGLYDSRKPRPEVELDVGEGEELSSLTLSIIYDNPADKLMIGG
jgi:hypothetical protein